jgi:hypothetical protein
VRPQKARSFRYWTRLHGLDGWQILGSACLVVGVLGFSVLIAHVRPTLPHTNGAYLLQTLLGQQPSDSAQPSTNASPGASPDPTQAAPLPSASRSGLFWWVSPSASAPPTRGPTGTPTATATASPSDSPTPRPGVHPSALPTPTPTPRPSVH